MTDIDRSTLLRDLETLRQDVLKADVLNAKVLQESVERHIAHAATLMTPSPALDEASFQLVNSVIALARLLYGQAEIAESEAGRRTALAALDRLAGLIGREREAGPDLGRDLASAPRYGSPGR